MQPNATELKVLPLVATPDKTKRGQCGLTVAHPLRVSGVPNDATLASFPASALGVNEAKLGHMSHQFEFHPLRCSPPPVIPAKAGIQYPNPVVPCEGENEGEALKLLPKWVEMEGNGSELKVSPRLATPNEANPGRKEAALVQCTRVNGVPNEATIEKSAPGPIARIYGWNERK